MNGNENGIREGSIRMTGRLVTTLCGRYEVIRDCGDYGTGSGRYSVWIGRRSDGQYDMLISDNASVWVLGDTIDADGNRKEWQVATAEVDADVLIAYGREADADLGNWLEKLWAEAMELQGDRMKKYEKEHNGR